MGKSNLAKALDVFTYTLDLDNSQRLHMLKGNIDYNYIDLNCLKEEFSLALNAPSTRWDEIANQSNLIEDVHKYTSEEIKNYIIFLLNDYIFPEQTLSENEIKNLNIDVENLLKKNESKEGWMFSYDLFNLLKEQEQYKNLEYYNLWKLSYFVQYTYNDGERIVTDRSYFNTSNILEKEVRIERKPIDNKDREIGFLRYSITKAPHSI